MVPLWWFCFGLMPLLPYRGGAVRFSFSLVAFGFVLFVSCLLGLRLFGNKFLIIQKKKKNKKHIHIRQ